MRNFKDHLIINGSTIKQALEILNVLAADSILFVIDSNHKLIGSLTDGDVRRGLLNGFNVDNSIDSIFQKHPRFIKKGENDIQKIINYRTNFFRILPVVDENMKVVNVINFRIIKSYLQIDTVIMAGGRGERLRPLTDLIPKPLLKIGDLPIIEHNINRMALFGIQNFWITLNYLGNQIENYIGNGESKNIKIEYIWEKEALGTIGAVSNIDNLLNDYVLISNSDLLTNIDLEHFFLDFLQNNADMSVLTIPYKVSIPYAVLETDNNNITKFKEKPTYTYYSNGGVYLLKREVLKFIPRNCFYNATDLMEKLINDNYKVISYPFLGYWLDIGRFENYEKGNNDIKYIKL